ncbi:amino acid permease-domain-containing protein [Fimicolochytrium jonesii]|uniref:amino acid permease-domain-containing protein n=1 Tax=Fimicolochytrium jonesii TaxID=1396493 RepID=UPI0022FEABBF|nr:amino acid permease-domain-containing protein [Fimicolochytrium jonesii]KAI8816639.1 amino acid permease-domain-containing protein [Fimicolochytrium jonesii]
MYTLENTGETPGRNIPMTLRQGGGVSAFVSRVDSEPWASGSEEDFGSRQRLSRRVGAGEGGDGESVDVDGDGEVDRDHGDDHEHAQVQIDETPTSAQCKTFNCRTCQRHVMHVDLGTPETFTAGSLRFVTSTQSKATAHGQPSRTPRLGKEWEFAGWGKTLVTELRPAVVDAHGQLDFKHQMDQYRATAIAAVAVTGGAFYSIGQIVVAAGQYAPISAALVCIVVFAYRSIFTELGVIPLNGGVYSLLLVGSTKMIAAMAACCAILDYGGSAVVSASTASNYFHGQWGFVDTYPLTICVLVVFAFLALGGVKDSANFGLGIFLIHLLTLLIIIFSSIVFWARNGSDTLIANWNAPSPSGNVAYDLFVGWCIGMLAFTGIETCPNYIEEQRPGVYPKTMRNLAYLVAFFMPALTLSCLVVLPRADIQTNVDFVLSYLGRVAVGRGLEVLISVDACIVLCGGVLSSFVGIMGLMKHMASDHLLPHFLLHTNTLTHTNHYIIAAFTLLCLLLITVTANNTTLLSLLFAIAFLCLLILFAVTNLLLKYKRGRLKRERTARWYTVLFGLLAAAAAVVGNGILSPSMIVVFGSFFGVLFVGMLVSIGKVRLLRIALFAADKYDGLEGVKERLVAWVRRARGHPVAFFTNHPEIHVLNKAVLYVAHNEPTSNLNIVHFCDDDHRGVDGDADPASGGVVADLKVNCHVLDHVYPKISINLIIVKGRFGPSAVACMAKALSISRNQCYITCPGEKVGQIGEFGGVRIIML